MSKKEDEEEEDEEEEEEEEEEEVPLIFDHKYFDQFSKVRKGGQRFTGNVFAPYGMHKGLPIYGPPNMDQIWPYPEDLPDGDETNYLGEDWKKKPPSEKRGGLWKYQMRHLESELIKDIHWIKVLGEGSFGVVWKVIAQNRPDIKQKWEKNPKRVQYLSFACKVIRHQTDERMSINTSLTEMTSLRHLRHENICNIKDVIGIPDRKTGFPYAVVCILFELCNGTLHEFILDGEPIFSPHGNEWALPEDLSKHWFRHAVRGLEYIHSEGFVHKDIKDNNILYLRGGVSSIAPYQERFLKSTFKLADFGIAETKEEYSEAPQLYERYETQDVETLFFLLLDYAIPTGVGDRNSSLKTYCKDRKWKSGYPEAWKTLSPELLSLVDLFEANVTASELLKHSWLQKDSLSEQKSTSNYSVSTRFAPGNLAQIIEQSYDGQSESFSPDTRTRDTYTPTWANWENFEEFMANIPSRPDQGKSRTSGEILAEILRNE